MEIKVEDLVDYHAIIGGDITSKGHIVTAVMLRPNDFGQDVARITDKTNCVAVSCLTVRDMEAAKESLVWAHQDYKGFSADAYYLKDSLRVLVEIKCDGEPYEKLFPLSYKVYNIYAHFTDIVDNMVSKESVEKAVSPLP